MRPRDDVGKVDVGVGGDGDRVAKDKVADADGEIDAVTVGNLAIEKDGAADADSVTAGPDGECVLDCADVLLLIREWR